MGKSKSKQQEALSPQGKAVDISMALLIKDKSQSEADQKVR